MNWVGNVGMTLTSCSFRYIEDQEPVLKKVTCQLGLTSRVGIVGPNGAGKSTLLSLLAGELLSTGQEGDVGNLSRHPQLRFAYIAQHHFHHLHDYCDCTPIEYIQARFSNGWDAERQKRLVLCQDPKAREYRKVMAAKYGGKPFYWCQDDNLLKGREVQRVLGRKSCRGQTLYEVEWCQHHGHAENSYETAQKLRLLGVEMLCLAMDSRIAYANMTLRPLTADEIVRHMMSFGFTDRMARAQRLSSFSAGQKSRLMLAASMWVKPHLLLVDEPTNFLDSATIQALANAISNFRGGVAIVSHSMDFLQRTCVEFWRVEEGQVSVPGREAHMERLQAKLARERERQEQERKRLGPSVGWEMDAENIGCVLRPDELTPAFNTFLAKPHTLPDHALNYAVQTFKDTVEDRKPSSSIDWLGAVIAAINAAESIGFNELGDMEYMAPVAVALLRRLLAVRALGSSDGGEALIADQVHAMRRRGRRVRSIQDKCMAMRWKNFAEVMEECCYCGKGLDPLRLEEHQAQCRMSPDRCGRRLKSSDNTFVFEMFHGTSEDAATKIEKKGFRPSVSGMLGPGVYCSRDLRKARAYGKVVFLLHVSLGRVIRIDSINHPLRMIWQTLTGGLYDCAWVPPDSGVVPSGLEENCVRLPSQIKVIRRVHWNEKAIF